MGSSSSAVEARDQADPTWKGVYRVGGMCMMIAGLCIIAVAILSIIIGPPPSGSELYLQSVGRHTGISFINFGLFALVDFLLVPGSLALYLALKHLAKNAMLIATALMLLFIVLDLAITELNSLTLVMLTMQYARATTEAMRAAVVGAASYALATLPLATFYSYVVSSIGLLIISIVMLKGVFRRFTAWAGLIASIGGIIGGFYIFVPFLAIFLTPCLIAFGVWAFFGGARLNALGKGAN